MKVKVLKPGEAAKEVEVQEGATIERVIQASGFNQKQMQSPLMDTIRLIYLRRMKLQVIDIDGGLFQHSVARYSIGCNWIFFNIHNLQ